MTPSNPESTSPSPEKPALPVLTVELPCVGCGYALKGLTVESRCPECGLPTAESLAGFPHGEEFAGALWSAHVGYLLSTLTPLLACICLELGGLAEVAFKLYAAWRLLAVARTRGLSEVATLADRNWWLAVVSAVLGDSRPSDHD